MNTTTIQAGGTLRRMLAIAAIAAIGLSLVFSLRVVLANDLHQSADLPISWDDQNFAGTEEDCANLELKPGEVLWHFVHTGTDGSDLPATLDANFSNAGDVQADGYSNGGGNAIVMYDIITGHDTLNSASDSLDDDNLLNLSHICVGPAEESQAESQSPEGSVEAGTGTPAGSQPNTAIGQNGVSPLPTVVFSLILLSSLGALAYANVKSARS